MKICYKFSHLNGEEYLIVHHKKIYKEIKNIITSLDANSFRTKVSKEKTMKGKKLFNPKAINKEYKKLFNEKEWFESRYSYYITLDRELMEKSINIPFKQQKKFLLENNEMNPIFSYKQTDFIKDKIAV